MPSTGFAPAPLPEREIVGPCLTSGGFQYFYLVCFSDCVIAVPLGIWTGLMVALSRSAGPPVLGLLWALLIALGAKRGQKLQKQTESDLARTPSARLRAKPNTVYLKSQLRSITLKHSKFAVPGSLLTPDIILETQSRKKKFGIHPADFAKASEQLKQMYPDLCRLS
jgi:hypothetical protein